MAVREPRPFSKPRVDRRKGAAKPAAEAPVTEKFVKAEAAPVAPAQAAIVEELLIEEVSIDGMCGVY